MNRRLIVSGGLGRGASGVIAPDDVWAFDLATRHWIQLLTSSGPIPTG